MSEISKVIASEIADFFAGFGGPGEPDIQSGEAQRLLTERVLSVLALRERAEPGNAEFGDAYQGAREDLQIWKRRALEAEGTARRLAEINDYLVLQAQGECHFGEPVVREPGALLHCAEQLHSGGTALYTAPPAPVVPVDDQARQAYENHVRSRYQYPMLERHPEDGRPWHGEYKESARQMEWEDWLHSWNACRAAMLATPGKEG
ncbi:hypothetical protein SMY00_002328 [Cronobacter sakazakii]|uniref:hypothetical protein n=1 Tax=Cronobacter sakazakii TaxID=28141 RepID=UPI000B3DF61A|nr:hypothetical protein [Cronobacter sakazakii]ELY3812383.1 hypothetical protein [Cronobacter sakazakii]PUW92941.1 hypothetical protein CCQ26_04495 [Cronobacter sakazakii]